MNRLWVRLSLAIGGLIAGVVALTASLIISVNFAVGDFDDDDDMDGGPGLSRVISGSLVGTVVFSGVVGMISGVVVSRLLSAPITQLAEGAKAIGQGDLNYRLQLGGSREITDLGTAFNQMAADLQHAEVLRRSLLADVSHELRTPLTVLEGHLRAALDHIYALDEAEIANLYGQTAHLIRLVNDLHELAQAEAHQLRLNKQPTDIESLLNDLLQMFEPVADEKAVLLKTQIAAPLPLLLIDASRIRQALSNLMTNALRYSPPHTEVTIGAAVEAEQLKITVADCGAGIEPDHLPHIFDRFYRVDASRSRDSGGTGLGLAIVKAIVETHGGQISAHSPGLQQGTVFTLLLPLSTPQIP